MKHKLLNVLVQEVNWLFIHCVSLVICRRRLFPNKSSWTKEPAEKLVLHSPFSLIYPFSQSRIHTSIICGAFARLQTPIISGKVTRKQANTAQQRQRNYHKAPNVKQLLVSLAATRLWFTEVQNIFSTVSR